MRVFALLTFLLLTLALPSYASEANTFLYAWTELGPHNQTIARVITTADVCPDLIINQNSILPMKLRAIKTPAYAVTTCETQIPANTAAAVIENQQLVLPKKNPRRIAIIGDTGCRLKWEVPPQACNDPNQWPFKKMANQIANLQPDLVIHVGDYHYREQACPNLAEGCHGSPYGYNWSVWQADFFKPAQKLLAKAPWIFVRGNHEDCQRAWRGWFRFLDPYPYPKVCPTYTKPYFIHLNNVTLVVMDSSNANDFTAPKKQVNIFSQYFNNIAHSKYQNIWLFTHKPVWSIADNNETIKPYSTLQKAIKKNFPSQLNAIFSGHIHRFQTINFNNKRPVQIINGNGGTRLDTEIIETIVHSFFVANSKLGKDINVEKFGFLLLEKTADGWEGQERNVDGNIVATCQLKQKKFICSRKQKA